MRIGIISDSHGQRAMVTRALALLDGPDIGGVDLVVHCGDVCGVGVFEELVGRPCRFVWGNMDAPDGAVMAFLQTVGLPIPPDDVLTFDADGKRVAVMHGHERGFNRVLLSGRFDYVLHGHTHQRRDERIGDCRVINPGALCRARPKTMAVLDTVADALTFYEVAA